MKTVASAGFVSAIAASLVQQTRLDVHVAGLGVPGPAIGTSVTTTLTAGAPALDQLTGSLLGLLGVHLGQADVRIAGVRCGQAVLVR